MTTEDKLKAYKDGFKDGFAEGYKQAKADSDPLGPYRDALKNYPPQNWTSCSVCGRTGVSGVVCTYPQCPNRVYVTSHTGQIGAVGSDYFNKMPVSSNGAAGY